MKRSKFNVSNNSSKRTYNGIIFDSELEMKYYRDVLIPQVKNGEITEYELQKKYVLQEKFKYNGENIRPIDYVADFWIKYKNGTEIVIDTKGMADATAKLKRKLFYYKYPNLDYRWVAFSAIDGGWCDYDYVQKQRRQRKKLKNKK